MKKNDLLTALGIPLFFILGCFSGDSGSKKKDAMLNRAAVIAGKDNDLLRAAKSLILKPSQEAFATVFSLRSSPPQVLADTIALLLESDDYKVKEETVLRLLALQDKHIIPRLATLVTGMREKNAHHEVSQEEFEYRMAVFTGLWVRAGLEFPIGKGDGDMAATIEKVCAWWAHNSSDPSVNTLLVTSDGEKK